VKFSTLTTTGLTAALPYPPTCLPAHQPPTYLPSYPPAYQPTSLPAFLGLAIRLIRARGGLGYRGDMSDPVVSTHSGSSTLARVSHELAELVERVGRSTVLVDGGGYRPGTGTVVGADLVLTANHVVDRDEGLTVRTADDRSLDAVLAGRDPASGLALLRVSALGGTALAPARDGARAGSLVIAVSRSWEGRQRASLGVVSGAAGPVRAGRGVRLDQVIRTDIAPSRGLSGSPVVTTEGEWLGLITAGLVRGVPLVIPYAIASQAIATITARGPVRRGYLGVALHAVRLPERQRAGREHDRGVMVVGVSPDGPADRAGVLVGDVITSAAGTPVTDVDDLQSLLLSTAAGTPIAIEVLRGASALPIEVTTGDRPV
jgi:S1-C subfamily serine protease